MAINFQRMQPSITVLYVMFVERMLFIIYYAIRQPRHTLRENTNDKRKTITYNKARQYINTHSKMAYTTIPDRLSHLGDIAVSLMCTLV